MQQFPNQQPDASSSESFQSMQPQVDAPSYLWSEPSTQVRDMVVYPNRKRVMTYVGIQAVCLFFMLLAVIFLIGFFSLNSPFNIIQIAAIILPLVAFFATFAFIFTWIIQSTISMIYPKSQPILTINSEGIIVGKMPLQSGFFILWSEIDTVFSRFYSEYEYLCILPKNVNQFMSRFHPLERFFRRLNAKAGSPLSIVLNYMNVPASEIMDRIRAMSGHIK